MTGILLKVASVSVFVTMSTLIKSGGEALPAGQIVFFRSAFAILPILAYLALRGQLDTAWRTANPLSHFRRGLVGVLAMGCGFYGIMHLPLPDAIAIGYAMPLLAVVFAALFLGEKVRIFRWSAVVVGLGGVLIISWPRLNLFGDGFGSTEAFGALAVLTSATLGATAMILVRKLVLTEKTPTIVLYFSLTATVLSLVTVPFGWVVPDWPTLLMMALAGFCGGLGQILLTQSYRHADVSTVAPFEYTSIILGILIGYFLFGDVPTWTMLTGTTIVVGAGLFVIMREHRLGLERRDQRKLVTPQG
ncbi:putative permease [Hoeflea phototrophica DFL-43]|uniref:Putative permease n=1 Tax=Hoeflea phototrophica (strain DSM 17068 / NCIMB 14078 / DFL-43) TaxID=411684 RepID=A9D420_HOEPD|nr:DMT family transporter [Hoeflea phototrophica]EDQ33793.1 putative permease [Hoeflea phototrophica DFL-43]